MLNHTSSGLYGQDGRRKYLAARERQCFMRRAWLAPNRMVATFCLTLAYCGCRISEALALSGHDVNEAECFIAFRTLKKRGALVVREVPVPRYLIALLVDVHAEQISRDTLLWSWCRPHAWQIVKRMMFEAGVPPGPHCTAKGLRHSFGIHAVRSGVPLNMVQRWLGHASLVPTSIYTSAVGSEERELAQRMWS